MRNPRMRVNGLAIIAQKLRVKQRWCGKIEEGEIRKAG